MCVGFSVLTALGSARNPVSLPRKTFFLLPCCLFQLWWVITEIRKACSFCPFPWWLNSFVFLSRYFLLHLGLRFLLFLLGWYSSLSSLRTFCEYPEEFMEAEPARRSLHFFFFCSLQRFLQGPTTLSWLSSVFHPAESFLLTSSHLCCKESCIWMSSIPKITVSSQIWGHLFAL